MISVQTQDFNPHYEYQKLIKSGESGAVVSFIGLVRDFNEINNSIFLQHYPGMTEKVLLKIESEAHDRWQIINTTIIHRIGELAIDEQIVYVGVSSAHRKEAFNACEFIIDVLKTQAPFWKKEGNQWVKSKSSDQHAADSWLKP